MASFTDFTPAGSTVTFIHRESHSLLWEQLQRLDRRIKRRPSQCRFRFVTHPHPTSTEVRGTAAAGPPCVCTSPFPAAEMRRCARIAVLQALLAAGIKDADTVVIGMGDGELADTQADARVLSALLQVRSMQQRACC